MKITIFDKRSMQKWRQHDKMVACWNFHQLWVVEDDLKLFYDKYIMLCHVSDLNLGLIAFILNELLTQDIQETSTVSRSDDVVIVVQG